MIDLEEDLHRRLVAIADAVPVEPALDRVIDAADRATLVPLTPSVATRPRRSLIAVSLAAAAALTAVLVVLPRDRAEAPSSVTAVENNYFPIVSALPSGVAGPLSAGFGVPANPPGFAVAEATIGRREGATIAAYIGISVATQDSDFAGTVGVVQTDSSGGRNRAVVVLQPKLTLTVWGTVTPEQVRAVLDEVSPTATLTPLAFTLPSLPAGFELIADVPAHLVSTAPSPLVGTDESRSAWIDVSIDLDPLPPLPDSPATATAVDINGRRGWAWTDQSNPDMHLVAWTAGAGVNVYVQGLVSSDQALAVARGVRFVDEATWRQHYRLLDPPLGPTTTGP